MPTFTCPRCASRYDFEGIGTAICPGCGAEIEHDGTAPPPVIPRFSPRTIAAMIVAPVVVFIVTMFFLAYRSTIGEVTKPVSDNLGNTLGALVVLAIIVGVSAALVVFVATWLFLPWLLLGRLREIRDELRELNGKTGKL